jgi:hypothetical protein
MIFWGAVAHEKGSEDVRNRREILKIDMMAMRPVGLGSVGRVCKNMSYVENGGNGNKESVFTSSLEAEEKET